MPELIGSFFILKVITLFSLRRDGWRGVLQALNRSHIVTSSPLPLGVPTDLQSVVKNVRPLKTGGFEIPHIK